MKRITRKKRALNYIRTKNYIRKYGYQEYIKLSTYLDSETLKECLEDFITSAENSVSNYKLKPSEVRLYDGHSGCDYAKGLITYKVKIKVK